MDCRNELPPIQEGKIIYNSAFSAFGLSLQGTSHMSASPPIPCQDYNGLLYLEGADILIAAIADGVGSCSLSHWGAYKAVRTVLGSLKAGLEAMSGGEKLVLTPEWNGKIKELLNASFAKARAAVEDMAYESGELTTNFQSTLTAVIYDGENLLYGHVGDDGIVVQAQDGTVHMATLRLKGEEASSVYPLQSGEKAWQFSRMDRPIAGFFMATDGVLDAFVSTRQDFFGINYNNGVNYSFMEEGIYTLAKNSKDATQKALTRYKDYMLSKSYRAAVTDDLTLIAVVSNQLIAKSKHPVFNDKIFQTIQQESNLRKRLFLDHREVPIVRLGEDDGSSEEKPMNSPDPDLDPRQASSPRPSPAPRPAPNPRPTPNPRPAPAPRQAPIAHPKPKPSRKKNPLARVFKFLAVLLVILIVFGAGFCISQTHFLPVTPEEFQEVEQSRDDYARENEELKQQCADLMEKTADLEQSLQAAQDTNIALEADNQSLTQKNHELAEALRQALAEAAEASEQMPDQE